MTNVKGRLRKISTGAGTEIGYYINGRVTSESVPTEVNSNLTATGDDTSWGWITNYQYYDWKGRVALTINTDEIDQTTLLRCRYPLVN